MNAPANRIPPVAANTGADDEIDIFELLAIIWNSRWLFIGIVAATVTLAAIYTTLLPSVYKVDTAIYPANDMQLARVSPGFSTHKENHEVGELTAKNLYDAALINLRSDTNAEKFLQQISSGDNRGIVSGFGQSLTAGQFLSALTVDITRGSEHATISLRGPHPERTAALLQRYLAFTSQSVLVAVTNDLQAAIAANIAYIDHSIMQARERAEQQIADKAAILTEAIGIAKALNIRESRLDQLAAMNIDIDLFSDKLYLFGTRALQAELEALMQRKNNDAFVPELRELESAKGAMQLDAEKIRRNLPDVQAFATPVSPSAPTAPHSPKPTLVMLGAIAVGIIAALFAVFFRQGIRTYRQRHWNPMANYKKAILRREGNYAAA